MAVDLEEILCRTCVYSGKYDDSKDEKKKYMLSMFGIYRENQFHIKRQNIIYNISIKQVVNEKTISVTSSEECSVMSIYYLMMEIMRFENLFDGRFFPVQSFTVDEIENVELIRAVQLAYYQSEKGYTQFSINFEDKDYRKYFYRWLKAEKKIKIIHPVFLFSTYLEGMPVDIRMALLLETFEPIAEELHKRGDITLIKPPYKRFSNKCKKCGTLVTRDVINKELTFADKIKPLLKKYGKEIFGNDNKRKLIPKAVKVRNKVDHVKSDTKNAMNGVQCGVYIYKFSLMYRYILLQEIGIESSDILPTIEAWVKSFEAEFGHLMV